MKNKKFIFSVLLCLFALLCFAAYGCSEPEADMTETYIEEAKTKVTARLNEKGYEYNDVEIEYSQIYNEYYYYNIMVVLNDTTDYAIMHNILTDISSLSFLDAFSECNMLFHEYVKSNDELYQLGLTNEYILQTSKYSTVYNSIAAKAGVGLTYKEKAKIYDDLDYYFTKTVDGKYKYTETEAETIVAEEYNITISYLLDEIWWNDTVRKYYLKYYN